MTSLGNLVAPEDAQWLSPVRFAYDWLHDAPFSRINKSPLQYNLELPLTPPDSPGHKVNNTGAVLKSNVITSCNNDNGFDVYPEQAGLPWPTLIGRVRQSRHWRAGMRMSTDLLELFATDPLTTQAVKKNGVSLARIASQELQVEEEERFAKFATYLFPEADEQRMRLCAAAIVYVIIFDGKYNSSFSLQTVLIGGVSHNADSWEMHSEDKLGVVRDDFVKRLEGDIEETPEQKTPLQALIDDTVQGFKDQDKISGDGGQEVIDRLIDFCSHVPPQETFDNLEDYLRYRCIDAAVP